jgi:hypothetical protein
MKKRKSWNSPLTTTGISAFFSDHEEGKVENEISCQDVDNDVREWLLLIVKGRVNDEKGVDDVEEKEDDAKWHPIFTSELKVKLMTQPFKKMQNKLVQVNLVQIYIPWFYGVVSKISCKETRKRDSAEDVG